VPLSSQIVKEKLLLMEALHIINAEGMVQLESQHFTTSNGCSIRVMTATTQRERERERERENHQDGLTQSHL
jgi:hypothetical protein